MRVFQSFPCWTSLSGTVSELRQRTPSVLSPLRASLEVPFSFLLLPLQKTLGAKAPLVLPWMDLGQTSPTEVPFPIFPFPPSLWAP